MLEEGLEEYSHVSMLEEGQDGLGGSAAGNAKGESAAPVAAVPCRSVLGVAAVAWGARRQRGDAGGGGGGCDGSQQWRQFDPGGREDSR